jgi:tripartite-type tricarboxylate transporter receptor subunit TctC
MNSKTRIFAVAMAALAAASIATNAFAQSNYPDRAVKVIVGYAPAGPVDIIARVMSDKLAGLWGKPVVVENVPGAGGNISGDRVAKAAPDGYTLLMGSNALLAINPSLYKTMSFDPNKDLIPICEAVYSPNLLVVPNDVPVKSVKELVDYARAHPGKLTYGSAGVGTTQHLAGELFKAMAHLDIQHVPYRGASPVITDLLAGRLTMFFGAIAPLLPLVHQGKVRALAVTSPKRFPAVPDMPTMIELGYPGFVSILSIGLMAPAGTPPAVIEKIHRASVKVLSMPDVRAKLNKIGMEVVANSPAEFKAAIDAERPQWAKIIKDAGISSGH